MNLKFCCTRVEKMFRARQVYKRKKKVYKLGSEKLQLGKVFKKVAREPKDVSCTTCCPKKFGNWCTTIRKTLQTRDNFSEGLGTTKSLFARELNFCFVRDMFFVGKKKFAKLCAKVRNQKVCFLKFSKDFVS